MGYSTRDRMIRFIGCEVRTEREIANCLRVRPVTVRSVLHRHPDIFKRDGHGMYVLDPFRFTQRDETLRNGEPAGFFDAATCF